MDEASMKLNQRTVDASGLYSLPDTDLMATVFYTPYDLKYNTSLTRLSFFNMSRW